MATPYLAAQNAASLVRPSGAASSYAAISSVKPSAYSAIRDYSASRYDPTIRPVDQFVNQVEASRDSSIAALVDAAQNGLDLSGDDAGTNKPRYVPKDNDNSGSAVAHGSLPPSVIDYLNAEMAKHYGMSRETAYAEAMENTAYQRAVNDMKAAGLNPATIFGAGRGSTAGSPSYISADSGVGGSSGSGRSSGSSRSRGSGSGGSSSNNRLFSTEMYNVISNGIGIATTIATGNMLTGYSAKMLSQNAMSMADGLFRLSKK